MQNNKDEHHRWITATELMVVYRFKNFLEISKNHPKIWSFCFGQTLRASGPLCCLHQLVPEV